MTIVMIVLKVIGAILLVLLSLLVLILGIVLFHPVRYRLDGRVEDGKLHVRGKIRWIFHMVGVDLTIRETQICAYGRILWMRKQFYPSEEDVHQETADLTAHTELSQESGGSAAKGNSQGAEESDFEAVDLEMEDLDTMDPEMEDFDTKREGTKHRHKPFDQRLEERCKKAKQLLQSIRNKGRDADRTRKKLIRVWEDEQNQMAWAHIKRELICLLKFLCPSRLRLDLVFSTGSPDTTGQLLGILALFPIGYRNRWHITPDFTAERAYAEGSFDCKGHLRLCHIAAILLRLVIDSKIRRLYRMLRKYFL